MCCIVFPTRNGFKREGKRRQRENRGHKKTGLGVECLLVFVTVYNPLLAGRGSLSAINEGPAFAFFTTKITQTHTYTHKHTNYRESLTEDGPKLGGDKCMI